MLWFSVAGVALQNVGVVWAMEDGAHPRSFSDSELRSSSQGTVPSFSSWQALERRVCELVREARGRVYYAGSYTPQIRLTLQNVREKQLIVVFSSSSLQQEEGSTASVAMLSLSEGEGTGKSFPPFPQGFAGMIIDRWLFLPESVGPSSWQLSASTDLGQQSGFIKTYFPLPQHMLRQGSNRSLARTQQSSGHVGGTYYYSAKVRSLKPSYVPTVLPKNLKWKQRREGR